KEYKYVISVVMSELPLAIARSFLLPRTDSLSTHPQAAASETVSRNPCGRWVTEVLPSAGVSFGLSHAY
ncbi:MAG: hypothetical protein QXS21_06265, partial [Thermoproteota archaeon]